MKRQRHRHQLHSFISEETFSQQEQEQESLSDHRDKTYQTNLEIARLANEGTAESAHKAHTLLTALSHPDTVTYNGVLKAYAKSNLPQPALELLNLMEHLQDSATSTSASDTNSDTTTTTTTTTDDAPLVKPNVISYSTVMDAFCRQQNPSVARQILARLVERYERYTDDSLKPNTIVYNCLLSAYAKSGLGPRGVDLAEQLLEKMGDLADVISYNIVLHAIAKSGETNACGQRAQQLLDTMRVTPNARTYSTVMDCWTRSDHLQKAEIVHSLLHKMEAEYNNTGHDAMRPNAVSYTVVINAYANSKDPDHAERAYQVLQHMLRLFHSGANPWAKPTLVTFNSVLNVCATSPPMSTRVHELVHDVYQTLLTMYTPDEFTYGTMLKACSSHVVLGTPQLVQELFEAACKSECVSFGVCYQFKQAAPSELFRSMIPAQAIDPNTGHFDVSKLPKGWTRNVKRPKTKG